jgi:acetyl-CoA carboxylase, biotin carboxylase subunit
VPAATGIGVDTHVTSGYTVPPHYDSLLCKVIAHGSTRDEAADRMIETLDGLVCEGVPTTAVLHRTVLASASFREHRYDTRAIPGWPPVRPSEHPTP